MGPAPVLVILCLCCLQSSSSEKKQIYLAGTFPIGGSEGWQGGQVRQHSQTKSLFSSSDVKHFTHQACLPAAKLALEDVNNNEDILKDYHINLADKDDEVRPTENLNV